MVVRGLMGELDEVRRAAAVALAYEEAEAQSAEEHPPSGRTGPHAVLSYTEVPDGPSTLAVSRSGVGGGGPPC